MWELSFGSLLSAAPLLREVCGIAAPPAPSTGLSLQDKPARGKCWLRLNFCYNSMYLVFWGAFFFFSFVVDFPVGKLWLWLPALIPFLKKKKTNQSKKNAPENPTVCSSSNVLSSDVSIFLCLIYQIQRKKSSCATFNA